MWLDLHVQRALMARDKIRGFDELPKREGLTDRDKQPIADLKGYNYVNDTIAQTMKRFAEQYRGTSTPTPALPTRMTRPSPPY